LNGDPGPEIVGPADVGPAEVRWEKKAEELEFEALANVRAGAEKWAASLGAVLGLTATVLVVKGREDISELSDRTQVAVGLILAVALVLAVIATVLAAYAAQGTPKDLKWPSGPKLREWERNEALTAKGQLATSRVVTLVAVVAIATAAGLTWFGPEAPSSGSTVLLAPESGIPLCGALVNGEQGLELEVEKVARALPPGPYSSVLGVERCPKAEPGNGG
jgi:hypothetical protein